MSRHWSTTIASMSSPPPRVRRGTIAVSVRVQTVLRLLEPYASAEKPDDRLVVIARRNEYTQDVDGRPESTRPRIGGRGGVANPTASLVASLVPCPTCRGAGTVRPRRDPDDRQRVAAKAIDRLVAGILIRAQAIDDAWQIMVRASDDDKERKPAGIGYCLVEGCGRYCSGAENDRLKGGLCPPCRTEWTRGRLPGEDLPAFRRRRAAVLKEKASVG